MANVDIPFMDRGGRTKTIRISEKTTTVDLSGKGMAAVNLSPLRLCTRLKRLTLNENGLNTLDLSPVAECPGLTVLGLKKNKLQSLDLSPLAKLAQIQVVDLRGNQLTALDLSPMKNHAALQKVLLEGNPMAELDVSALLTCKGLKKASLGKYSKLKADRAFRNFNEGAMLQYKNNIAWVETEVLEARRRTVAAATSQAKASAQDPKEAMRKKVLGVLRSHSRINMKNLMPYSELPIDDTRKLVFELVGSGAVAGRFEPESDEFISLDAVQTAKEMRSEGTSMSQCAFCGKPIPRVLMPGERYVCESCGRVSEA